MPRFGLLAAHVSDPLGSIQVGGDTADVAARIVIRRLSDRTILRRSGDQILRSMCEEYLVPTRQTRRVNRSPQSDSSWWEVGFPASPQSSFKCSISTT